MRKFWDYQLGGTMNKGEFLYSRPISVTSEHREKAEIYIAKNQSRAELVSTLVTYYAIREAFIAMGPITAPRYKEVMELL